MKQPVKLATFVAILVLLAGAVTLVAIDRLSGRPFIAGSPSLTPSASSHVATPTDLSLGNFGSCLSSGLTVRLLESGTNQNGRRFELAFTNTGPDSCQMSGFPDVSFIGDDGRVAGEPAEHDTDSPQPIISLPPSGAAVASLYVSSSSTLPSQVCGLVAQLLRIVPPDNKDPLTVPLTGQACTGWSVTAVNQL